MHPDKNYNFLAPCNTAFADYITSWIKKIKFFLWYKLYDHNSVDNDRDKLIMHIVN